MRLARPLLVIASLLCGAAAPARAKRCPNLLFVLDRSGSMDETPDGKPGKSKWKLLQEAVAKTVAKFGDRLPIGLEMFTSSGATDQACFDDTVIDVEPAHDTGAQIVGLVLAARPSSGTNTAQAIRRAAQDGALHDPSRGQYVVLVTDGDPNCPGDDSDMAVHTVKEIAVAAARAPAIHTFVVGFDGAGLEVKPDNLNRMAIAGKEPIPGCAGTDQSPCYYSASNAQRFADAVDKIVTFVAGGEFGTTQCDDTCMEGGCPAGQRCVTEELDLKPHCVDDPCAGADKCSAAKGEFCRSGQCVRACLAPCRAGQRCVDGDCVADPCPGRACPAGGACDPDTGLCSDRCVGRTCRAAASTCDLSSGACVPDPCHQVSCPPGTACRYGGNCEATRAPAGGSDGRAHATPGCGVGVGVASPGGPLAFVLALFTGVFLDRLRARRRRGAPPPRRRA